MSRILFISNSTNYGRGFLDHAEAEIRSILGGIRRVLFVPYALYDQDRYSKLVSERFACMGIEIEPIHIAQDPATAARKAAAVFVGGGNTFRLLDHLQRHGLIQTVREAVHRGAVYIGSSAGVNVACPTIKTTNDMPIVEPASLDALGLVPFNVNPHYFPPDSSSTHMGEDRDARIQEFHEENEQIVIGLREGGMLRIDGGSVTLVGEGGARVFRKGEAPLDHAVGSRLDFLCGDARARQS